MNLPPARPDLDVLLDRALKTGGETDAFDFKATLDFQGDGEHKIKLLKAIGSFHNTDNGGHVIIGVTNDRVVVGVTPELAATYDQTPVQRMVGEYFAPPPTVQVRQHQHDGKLLVIIEVQPFRDFPSIVKKYEIQGKEKLQDGTFLVRNAAAESALLTSEVEVRKLCDAIATRRARSIVELIQRGTRALSPLPVAAENSGTSFAELHELRRRATTSYWGDHEEALPYLETFFGPQPSLDIPVAQLKALIPSCAIPVRHGFPFHSVSTFNVTTTMPWGWLGMIPFDDTKTPPATQPTYLWLLGRSGAFVYREKLWEDQAEGLANTVGIYHVLSELVLTVRFLDRIAAKLDVADTARFRVGIALNNVRGRPLVHENGDPFSNARQGATERQVEASLDVTIGGLRASREDLVISLAEEIAWRFRRQDWSRQDLAALLRSVPQYLGVGYAFPEQESIAG